MKIRNRIIFAILAFFFLTPFVFAAEDADRKSPVMVVPQDTFEHPPVIDGKTIFHEYVIQNRGTAELKIEKVKTS